MAVAFPQAVACTPAAPRPRWGRLALALLVGAALVAGLGLMLPG